MSPRTTLATTARVLTQLRRDPRTIALIVGVPVLLVTLLRFVFDDRELVFDRIGGPLLGLFPFVSMFVVTSITSRSSRSASSICTRKDRGS